MATVSFGRITALLLFGGGSVLRHTARRHRGEFAIHVFTSPRLIGEQIDGLSLDRFLVENTIPYEVTSHINGSSRLQDLLTRGGHLGISFGAPWIFDTELIARFGGALLNLHSRDLPRNRGGGGASWLILNDDRRAANVLHVVAPGVDTGDIVKRREFSFPASCRIPAEYDEYAAALDNDFIDEFLAEVRSGATFPTVPQDEEESVYFPRLHTATQGFIDWSWATDDIVRFIRAFDSPYGGSSTYWRGSRIFLKQCAPAPEHVAFHPFTAGLVYRKGDGWISVTAAPAGIRVRSVSDESGVSVLGKIKLGDRLHTPMSVLEGARTFRPVYTPDGLRSGPERRSGRVSARGKGDRNEVR